MQTKTPFFSRLYVQVLIAIALGVTLGAVAPDLGAKMKPLGDAFIKLIKMMIAPIIFATVVVGIAKMGDMKEVGRVGVKALFYFEAVTTLALVIGLIVVNLLQPGAGLNIDPHTLHAKDIAKYTAGAKEMNTVDFLLHIIPDTVVGAFASGEILQVLTFSVLLGLALTKMGDNGKTIVHILDEFSHALFGVINMLMKLAPIGAFGAMAFTIGKYGIGSLKQLGFLMACVYLTCFAFVFIVLGAIARFSGFSLWRFLVYIKEEILLVLGTSSSESALPGIMKKLENLGCAKPVVGMVVPTGYSFNLDGTSIYLTMAAIFIAQATNVNLTLGEELAIIGVLLLTSKGAAAVTGGGFITLAATLATLGGKLPVEGLALLIGIDRFMSEARAITNLIGNGVATVVIAKWEKALDVEQMNRVLAGDQPSEPPPQPREQPVPQLS
ncbi:dicarboxylate/amino acid:cation symporter [Chromobacterium amazonense]|uniref:C4-dicarboxylate transport protein n=1 Tax=Chromobacterium amazonense TaxID=1382803 RepID=A0ABU8V1U0_9NEIS|nr:dicarboxylate/amino acid:cation symporter [Chromobacterium amazonense]MDQ4540434.1 dicarboxylate/amino acid:cation symporter [Chromobacterium amazonense]OHX16595.1 C4-dicarboxylate transporter DctA [Chromobacterium amazonense]